MGKDDHEGNLKKPERAVNLPVDDEGQSGRFIRAARTATSDNEEASFEIILDAIIPPRRGHAE